MKTSTEIKAALLALRETYIETAKAEFTDGFAALFQQYPQLKSVSWTQYTPYFNDGEECRFSVNRDLSINGFDSYDSDKDSANLQQHSDKNASTYDKNAAACVKAVTKFYEAFDDDVFKELFDDHVEVTVTAKGVTTSDYEHD